MTDDEIIRLLEARQEEGLSALTERYGTFCKRIVLRLLPQSEDAEEIVNDVWHRVWESIPPQKPESLQYYLAKLARNLAFDQYRRQNADKRGGKEIPLVLDELASCLPAGETPETALHTKELGAEINRFLDRLPSRTQDIFLRRYFFSESVSEIAERYHMREDNVRLTLSRTRIKLKSHLKQGGYL